ncbi:MAG: acetyl-CoA carboxylase biotin carboxyl carrier protein [Treponema sp.]|jgi:acetyl-CoA carboxylase biotin carboxyl carrier protein|nr:acetyl-CoA carboxylase biotin carboxyl carrier protein [Treponema sp.]
MPINEDFILKLIDKFSSAAVAELRLEDGDVRIELRTEAACAAAAASAASAYSAPAGGSAPGGYPAGASPAPPVVEGLHLGLPAVPAKTAAGEAVTSPIVATFYASPRPDAPSFVTVGSRVKSGDTLCILEAMKMMNHLEAEFDCEILAVKASSGDLVEYGQTLFEVKRL